MTEFAKSVKVEKLRMSAIGCYNALPGTTSDGPRLHSLGWTSGHRGPLLGIKWTAIILSAACTNTSIMKCIRSMWYARFGL